MGEAHESSIVAPVAEGASFSTDDAGLSLDALLSNRDQLSCLVFLMREYVHQLEAVESLCIRVLNKHVCYLFDFDVIKNYLEMKSADREESFPVKYLFSESKIPFAIPIGAFEELLSYLTSLSRTSYELSRLEHDCNKEQAAKLISAALGVPDVKKLTHANLVAEIEERLDASILELSRLLEILHNPRFQGVRTAYDERCCDAWLKVVSVCKRPHWKPGMPRSKVDKRDAMNLAVASRYVRSQNTMQAHANTGSDVYELLVSQTSIVFDLPRHAEDRDELRYVAHYFGMNPHLLSTIHPAIHPWDAKRADQLGALDRPVDGTLARLKAWGDNFREVTGHLMNQLIWNTGFDPTGACREAVAPFVAQHREELHSRLQRMRHDVLDTGSEMCQIEEDRATGESEEMARRRQTGKKRLPYNAVRMKALQFRRLLGQIGAALDGTQGVEYEAQIISSAKESPFARLRIAVCGEKEGTTRPVITGELYRQNMHANDRAAFQYFSVRWPVTCLEEHLIEGLTRIWRVTQTEKQEDPTSTKLTCLTDDPECWRQGLIVRTASGNLFMSLKAASTGGKWSSLKMCRLASLVENAGTQLESSTGEKIKPAILQLRINTLFGDIIYDVETLPNERRRYIRVVSHCNVGNMIAELYHATGVRFSIPRKLGNVLSDVLQDFCPIPT